MKILALIFGLSCTLGLATTVEHQVVWELKGHEDHVKMLLAQIRSDYHADRAFITAFNAAQKKWDEYCVEMLELRFPEKKKREEYGSAYYLAYSAARRDMFEARIKDLMPYTKAPKPSSDEVPKKSG